MHVTVCAVGKIREKWLLEGIREYTKRLSRYMTVRIDEVPDVPDSRPMSQILEEEGQRLLSRIRPGDHVVLLDLDGESVDSLVLSYRLSFWMERGGARVTFVIGGSNGVSEAVRQRANARLCLSPLTFTHAMARLILLEQLYRASRIRSGEPYHK